MPGFRQVEKQLTDGYKYQPRQGDKDDVVAPELVEVSFSLNDGISILDRHREFNAPIVDPDGDGDGLLRTYSSTNGKLPLGLLGNEDCHKYWDQRLRYFSFWDDGVLCDVEGIFSVVPEAIARHNARKILHYLDSVEGNIVLADPMCGIGGTTIALARELRESGQRGSVVACDIDPLRAEFCFRNIKLAQLTLKLSPVSVICGDSTKLTSVVPECSAVVTSPPWGGPSYSQQGSLYDPRDMPYPKENSPYEDDGTRAMGFYLNMCWDLCGVPKSLDSSEEFRFLSPVAFIMPRNTSHKIFAEAATTAFQKRTGLIHVEPLIVAEKDILNGRHKLTTYYIYWRKLENAGRARPAQSLWS